MAIDVGAAYIDRTGQTIDALRTYIGEENPANADGTIDTVCLYVKTQLSGCEVASFNDEGSNVLSTSGTATIGTVPTGEQTESAPGDFTAFNINTGEHIGLKYSGGQLERDDTGVGYWYIAADRIPTVSETFSYQADRTISLYATGTETGGEPSPGPGLMVLMV